MNSDIAQKAQTAGGLTVHYLDVGQGNAILLQSEGQTMLIDGGARKSSSFVVSYLEKQKIEKLDYVLIPTLTRTICQELWVLYINSP